MDGRAIDNQLLGPGIPAGTHPKLTAEERVRYAAELREEKQRRDVRAANRSLTMDQLGDLIAEAIGE